MNWRFWVRLKQPKPETCGTVASLLSLYADKIASPAQAQRAGAHLADCESCRKTYEWMLATREVLSSRPAVLPPVNLRARVARAIAAQTPAPALVRSTRRPLRLQTAYAAAASIVLFGALALTYTELHRPIVQPVVPSRVQVRPKPPMMAFVPRHTVIQSNPAHSTSTLPIDPFADLLNLPDAVPPMDNSVKPQVRNKPLTQTAPQMAQGGQAPNNSHPNLPVIQQHKPVVKVQTDMTHMAILPPKRSPLLVNPLGPKPDETTLPPTPAQGTSAPPSIAPSTQTTVVASVPTGDKHSGGSLILADVISTVTRMRTAAYTPPASAVSGQIRNAALVAGDSAEISFVRSDIH